MTKKLRTNVFTGPDNPSAQKTDDQDFLVIRKHIVGGSAGSYWYQTIFPDELEAAEEQGWRESDANYFKKATGQKPKAPKKRTFI